MSQPRSGGAQAGARYDVVIVGAGPAGCAAALSLPPETRALLVERSSPDRERCCGGLLAPDAQQALTSLGLVLPAEVRVQPEPHTVRVHDLDSGRGQSYRRDYLNIDRARFDAWLLRLAAERVEIRQQTRFAGIEAGAVRLRSGSSSEKVDAAVIVGADGAGSAVRRACFPDRPAPPLMLALQATLPRPSPRRPGVSRALAEHVVLFASELTSFYAWAIPKEDDWLIGCAFHERQAARERFERVLDWYREELGLEDEVSARSARYLSQPTRRSHLCAGGGRVLLAGEAAGLVSPSSGEGISFALLSGAAAGHAAGGIRDQDGQRRRSIRQPAEAYERAFAPLARKIVAKMVKARIIYSPAARTWALRLPWCP